MNIEIIKFKDKKPNHGDYVICFHAGFYGEVRLVHGQVEYSWFNNETGDSYSVEDEDGNIHLDNPPEDGCELIFHIIGERSYEPDAEEYYINQDELSEKLYQNNLHV